MGGGYADLLAVRDPFHALRDSPGSFQRDRQPLPHHPYCTGARQRGRSTPRARTATTRLPQLCTVHSLAAQTQQPPPFAALPTPAYQTPAVWRPSLMRRDSTGQGHLVNLLQ